MSFENLFSRMLVLFVFVLVGFVAGKTKLIDDDGSKKINKIMLCICQPAITIGSVLNTELNVGALDVVLLIVYALLMNLILVALGFVAVRIMRINKNDRGTFNFMTAFGNVVFVGLPVMTALYGNEMIFFVSICSMPFLFLAYSVGILLIAGRGTKTGLSWKLMLNPTMFSIIIALLLFFFKIKLPAFIGNAAADLGAMVIPCSMLLIGVSLAKSSLRDMIADPRIYAVCFIKLILAPFVIWLIFRLFISNEIYLSLMVVSAAMPSAVLSSMLPMEYGGNPEAGSRGIFVTTLFSLITIPLMVYLLLI